VNKSPFNDLHVQLGAKMVDFAGWSMPVMYRSIVDEHQHTRKACSLFDVSHMGRIEVSGPDAETLLQRTCTRDLSDMPPGLSRYTHMCRADGGILDDVIVSRFENHFLVVCNAANREKILAWLQQHGADTEAAIEDCTFQSAMVAVQGPSAIAQIESLVGVDLSGLKRYHFMTHSYMTFRFPIFRSGYTGEDGVEMIFPVNLVKLALPMLIGMSRQENAAIKPAGLGARDSLRLEAGMPLYGHELTEEWDSLTARQGWCVHLDKKDFIGADAMRRRKSEGLDRRIVGLELAGRRTARQGYAVTANGSAVGAVTSGVLSPTLDKSIAMALVQDDVSREGTTLQVRFGDKTVDATVVKLPFYRLGH
jgi:aminomethyltransferase